jgi:hypothetical protein
MQKGGTLNLCMMGGDQFLGRLKVKLQEEVLEVNSRPVNLFYQCLERRRVFLEFNCIYFENLFLLLYNLI